MDSLAWTMLTYRKTFHNRLNQAVKEEEGDPSNAVQMSLCTAHHQLLTIVWFIVTLAPITSESPGYMQHPSFMMPMALATKAKNIHQI